MHDVTVAGNPPAAPTRRGRWAEAERNDVRVLDAARAVFGRIGPNAPVSAVAREAGVGMGTLYRRYGSKEELLQRLWLLSMVQTYEVAEAALAANDEPFDALAEFVRWGAEERIGALSSITGTFPMTDEINASLARVYDAVEAILERGRAAGQIRDDVTTIDLLWLVVLFANPSPAIEIDRLVDFALDGLRPPA
jgi:AcrR family transcriptional regulator